MLQGWVLTEQGQVEKGVRQMHEGLAASGATRTRVAGPYNLALLVEGYMKMEQPEGIVNLRLTKCETIQHKV